MSGLDGFYCQRFRFYKFRDAIRRAQNSAAQIIILKQKQATRNVDYSTALDEELRTLPISM